MANEEEAFVDVVEIGEIETEKTPNRKRKQCKGKARKWSDEETDLLIDLLEQNGCQWDVFWKEYHLKDNRDKPYAKMQDALSTSRFGTGNSWNSNYCQRQHFVLPVSVAHDQQHL